MADTRNEMDAFEQQVKTHLEHYEVPYNQADWAQMDRALSSGVRSWGHGRALVAGLLLAGGLLIGGSAYFIGRDKGTQLAEARTNDAVTGTVLSAQTMEQPAEEVAHLAENTTLPSASGATDEPAQTQQAASPTRSNAPGVTAQQGTGGTPVNNRPEPNSAPVIATPTAPASAFRASAKETCPGDPVNFTVESMPEDGIYLWNFGDGNFSNKANPEHVFTKPGTYQVMLSMSSSGAGAIRNKASSGMIVIHEAPLAAFNVLKMDAPGEVPRVHFESRAEGAHGYQWDLGDGTVSTEANPDHVYRKKGTYQVVQTVTNATGCVDRKVKELVIDHDFDMAAPARISPDNNGTDDSFMPQTLTQLKAKFSFTVYDPAGRLVYSTSDARRPWLGKAHNQGAVLPAGNYVWVADVVVGQGTETFNGTVQLVK